MTHATQNKTRRIKVAALKYKLWVKDKRVHLEMTHSIYDPYICEPINDPKKKTVLDVYPSGYTDISDGTSDILIGSPGQDDDEDLEDSFSYETAFRAKEAEKRLRQALQNLQRDPRSEWLIRSKTCEK